MQTVLRELIRRQRTGWSLEQAFYTSDEIYDFERRVWLAGKWYVLAHSSELREPGSFITRELLGESLIIVRDTEGALRGFYNVCRHRGSRICDEDGRANRLVCPYHAWSYHLDGTLQAAPALIEGIDKTRLGLKSVPVREMGGMILGSLTGDLQDLDMVEKELGPGLRYCGIPEARIAARRSYSIQANWKLVMENFFECYHCAPAHPEYCSVMKYELVGQQSPAVALDAHARFREESNQESPLGLPPEGLREIPMYFAWRTPIGPSHTTQTQDGKPVAPLMGQQRRFDGGLSEFACQPFVFVFALNDYAVMFQFLPTAPQCTDVSITWLVDSSVRDTSVDVEKLIWFWNVTTLQDKRIIERNAGGVRSQAYEPGPYATRERWPSAFVGRYLRELAVCVNDDVDFRHESS